MGHLEFDLLTLRISITLGVAVLLCLISWRFNARIDNLERDEMHDGQTAVQVAVGVTYTIIGYGIMVAAWTSWVFGVVVIVTLFVTFAISGFPMFVGDALRSKRARRDQRERYDRQ